VRRGQTLVILGQKFAQKGQRIFGCWHRVLARIVTIFGEQRWDTVGGEPVTSPQKSQTTATISAPAKSRLCLFNTRGNKHDAATLSTRSVSGCGAGSAEHRRLCAVLRQGQSPAAGRYQRLSKLSLGGCRGTDRWSVPFSLRTARATRLFCSRLVKHDVLIAFDAPGAMRDVGFDGQHRPGAVRPVKIIVSRRFPFADETSRQGFAV